MSDEREQEKSEETGEDPKVIVDEDWKTRVQAEREAAKAAEKAAAENPPADDAGAIPPAGEAGAVPPASFEVLVNMLAMQALAAFGQIPDPAEGHPVVRPDVAKHYIDMLGMLEEKTKGNLTDDESRMMTDLLHQLRMLFVSVRKPETPEADASS